MTADLVTPHNLAAERAVLGAVLVNNDALPRASAIVQPVDFFRHEHGRLFSKMLAVQAHGAPIDYVTLANALGPDLENIGGPAYLFGLTDGVPRSTNVEEYAGIVKQMAHARTVVAYARQAVEEFCADPSAVSNGAGTRFSEAIRRAVDEAHSGNQQGVSSALIDDVAVLNVTEPEWAIRDIVPELGFIVLYGEPEIGKSAVAIGISVSRAAGEPFLGHDVPLGAPVVYVPYEGAHFMGKRIAAAKMARGISIEQAIGVHTYQRPLNLLNASEVTQFIQACRSLNPRGTVLDTWTRAMAGGDENSAKDVGIAVAAVNRIQRELHCFVLVLHHTNRAQSGERGSGALRGAADVMIGMTKTDDQLQITCEKMKDFEHFPSMDVALVPVPGVNACVVRLAADVAPAAVLTDAQGQLLHVLREVFGDEGATATDWQRALPHIQPRTYFRAKEKLRRLGYITTRGKQFVWTGKTPLLTPTDTAHDTAADID